MAKTLYLDKINALAELERAGWKYEPRGAQEVVLRCPVHDDSHPSVSLNVQKNVWKCQACGAKGDIVSLICHIGKAERKTVLLDMSTRYDLSVTRVIKSTTVERYHQQIWDAGPLLQALRDRGITDDLIRSARLGYHNGRITIPIHDERDQVINVRMYLPGAPGHIKMRNTRGFSKLAMYLPRQVEYNSVWICGGELKALLASSILNAEGIGAVAMTGGEGAWDHAFTPRFKDKIVYICMDVDAAGNGAARKVAAQVSYAASSVRIVRIPLDTVKYPTGDINDWVVHEKAELKDFLAAMEAAELYKFEGITDEPDEIAEEVSLGDAGRGDVGKRVIFDCTAVAMDTAPYVIPRTIATSCQRDQPFCYQCRIKPLTPDEHGITAVKISPTARPILDMVQSAEKHQPAAIRRALGIPDCKMVTLKVRDHHKVVDIRLAPQLSITGTNEDHVVQTAYYVGSETLELNVPYRLSGRMFPHPKHQQTTLLLDEVHQTKDGLTAYDPEDKELEALKLFRPKRWSVEGLDAQLDEVYEDIVGNVTRIYQRRDLHLTMDLTWHSVLFFTFDDRVQNGWINALVTGDTSQGKTEASMRLLEHYGLGQRHDCKNATAAGLLGGLQQLGASNRWFISWGVIPSNDRRLVVMEEIKGVAIETLGTLTDMRSSGVAELTRIEKRRAHARTRLLMISNPRSGRPVSTYNYGIESIAELIGNPEDIRRFDLAMVLESSQVESAVINKLSRSRKIPEHKFTAALSKMLVLYAWTRSEDQIRFEPEAMELCLEKADELCETFTEAVPLVDRGTMKFKLARLAIALAARTFSTLPKNLRVLLVRPCHVEYIAAFLDRLYSCTEFGYRDFSLAERGRNVVTTPDRVVEQLKSQRYPADLVAQLLSTDEITSYDLSDWCDTEPELGRQLMSFLVRKNCMVRKQRFYYKTSGFITLLKKLRNIANEATPTTEDEL